jgi:hypothetical protein
MSVTKGDSHVVGNGRQHYDFNDRVPESSTVVEVRNPRGSWIEARFVQTGDGRWQLEFAADDICPMEEALDFFAVWREHVVIPMTLKTV